MKVALTVSFLAALIFISPAAVHAQRAGFSIGTPASQLRSVGVPQMPPLPRPLPTPLPVALPSLQLTLKPLNLVSNHLAPPQIDFAPDPRRTPLPVLPFALNPIAAQSFPEICVDPAMTRAGR